ncbi:MAG: hypothetical protein M0P58_02230 [Bacteroidales bacterium]|nr:hypothetical protein [Bacteroidales bacterium]
MKIHPSDWPKAHITHDQLFPFLFILSLFTLLSSCSKDDFDFDKMTDPDWSPTWSAPLIHSNLTLHDILKKGGTLFIEDPVTHQLTLEYGNSLFSQSAEQYLQVPDQKDMKIESAAINIVVGPGDSTYFDIEAPYSFSTSQEGQVFDSIFVKTGAFDMDISSQINHSIKVIIRLPNAVKNGKGLEITTNLPYAGTLPVQKTISIDLSGYTIRLNNTPGHVNEIIPSAHMIIYGDDNPNNSPYTFTAICDLINLKFSKIIGYFGQYNYPLEDTLYLNLFKNNMSGNIHLEEIDLFLKTTNSIGMPIQLTFNDLIAHSDKNPPYTVNIADPSTGFPNPITIPSPDLAHMGTSVDTTFQFGENNSNIIPAINLSPTYIYFNINGMSNPANNPAFKNFVYDTSRFSVDFDVVLPLFGAISGFYVEDTVDFDFDIPNQASMVDFKVRTENHFPLNAEIQIYFADKDYNILDSLFSSSNHQILVAAPVGPAPDYRVIENPPIKSYTFSPDPFYKEDLERLKQTRFLMIQAKLSTYAQDLVKIYADYKLDVKLAAKITITSQN